MRFLSRQSTNMVLGNPAQGDDDDDDYDGDGEDDDEDGEDDDDDDDDGKQGKDFQVDRGETGERREQFRERGKLNGRTLVMMIFVIFVMMIFV